MHTEKRFEKDFREIYCYKPGKSEKYGLQLQVLFTIMLLIFSFTTQLKEFALKDTVKKDSASLCLIIVASGFL